jgi:hypothetical protein
MEYLGKTRNPGPCAYAPCDRPGTKLYRGDGYIYKACTKGHAEACERGLLSAPRELREAVFGEGVR